MADGGFQGPDPQTLWGWIAAAIAGACAAIAAWYRENLTVKTIATRADKQSRENSEKLDRLNASVRTLEGKMDVLLEVHNVPMRKGNS